MAAYNKAQRDAMAQGKGYRSYQDYREHGYGAIPPGTPVGPAQKRQYSGHAGLRELTNLISRRRNRPIEVQPRGLERGQGGRWRTIMVVALLPNGSRQVFYLRGRSASQDSLKALKRLLSDPGSGQAKRDVVGAGGAGTGGGSEAGGGGVTPPGSDDEEESEEDEYQDFQRYSDEYDYDYDYEPIPYLQAASVDVFAG